MTAGQMPRWADYILMPAINVAAAFFVSGLVVLAIGYHTITSNPTVRSSLLLWHVRYV